MNKANAKYSKYLSLSNDWPLDDWSIPKECFDKIVEILPFGSTILEIGSGNSTYILSLFYKVISVESNKEWLNKFDSTYYHIEEQEVDSKEFGKTLWLNPDKVIKMLDNLEYDLLIVDAGGRRIGIYDYIDYFKTDIPIIFDDTQPEDAHAILHKKCAELIAKKHNKTAETFRCKVNKYCAHWWNGKCFTLLK